MTDDTESSFEPGENCGMECADYDAGTGICGTHTESGFEDCPGCGVRVEIVNGRYADHYALFGGAPCAMSNRPVVREPHAFDELKAAVLAWQSEYLNGKDSEAAWDLCSMAENLRQGRRLS